MLDADLAALYGVTTGNLNKAVKRNLDRFPPDFMFQLTSDEAENLRFQIGISSLDFGGRRYLPYAFTEQGVAMLSSVLRSKRAVQVNIGSCAPLFSFARCCPVIPNSPANWPTWSNASRATTPPSVPFSMPSASSWPRPRLSRQNPNRLSRQRRRRPLPHQTKSDFIIHNC